jgi:hypothetical protein
MTPPLVSIVIPAYNTGPYLEPAIRSALDQTWPRTEVIVVDDGSTDGSLEVARRFEGEGLRVIAQKNAGSCAARNAGARAARGEYIQFFDHDDLLAPDKIAAQLADWRPDISPRTLLMGEIVRFYDTPEGVRHPIPADDDYHPAWAGTFPQFPQLPAREWLFRWWTIPLETTPLAWLIHRDLLVQAGPWEERFLSRLDDFEFLTRVLLAADNVICTPGARAFFRTRVAGSMSSLEQNRSRRAFEGQWVALSLCADHLLATDTSQRARESTAALLMRYAYSAYPAHAHLARQAESRSRTLNATLPPCPGGRLVRTLSPILGWKFAKRLQHLAIQWGYSRA